MKLNPLKKIPNEVEAYVGQHVSLIITTLLSKKTAREKDAFGLFESSTEATYYMLD